MYSYKISTSFEQIDMVCFTDFSIFRIVWNLQSAFFDPVKLLSDFHNCRGCDWKVKRSLSRCTWQQQTTGFRDVKRLGLDDVVFWCLLEGSNLREKRHSCLRKCMLDCLFIFSCWSIVAPCDIMRPFHFRPLQFRGMGLHAAISRFHMRLLKLRTGLLTLFAINFWFPEAPPDWNIYLHLPQI